MQRPVRKLALELLCFNQAPQVFDFKSIMEIKLTSHSRGFAGWNIFESQVLQSAACKSEIRS